MKFPRNLTVFGYGIPVFTALGMLLTPFAFASAQTIPANDQAALQSMQQQLVADQQALSTATAANDQAQVTLASLTHRQDINLSDFAYRYGDQNAYPADYRLTAYESPMLGTDDIRTTVVNVGPAIEQVEATQKAQERAQEHMQNDANAYRSMLYNLGLPEPTNLPHVTFSHTYNNQ